jgi:hypothetical protein
MTNWENHRTSTSNPHSVDWSDVSSGHTSTAHNSINIGGSSASCTGNAATADWADTVDVNTSTSSSWFDLVFHSSDSLYSAVGIDYQPSTDSIRF